MSPATAVPIPESTETNVVVVIPVSNVPEPPEAEVAHSSSPFAVD